MSEFETWGRSNSGVYVTYLRGTFCTLRWDYQRSLELDGSGEIWREFGVVSLLCTEFSLKSLRWVDGDESAKLGCMPKHDDLNRQILSSIENCEAAHPDIFCSYVSRMVPETYERSRIVVVWSSVFVIDTGTAFEGDLFTLLILPSLNLTMQARLSSFKCLCINLVFDWFPVPVDYELFSSEVWELFKLKQLVSVSCFLRQFYPTSSPE